MKRIQVHNKLDLLGRRGVMRLEWDGSENAYGRPSTHIPYHQILFQQMKMEISY